MKRENQGGSFLHIKRCSVELLFTTFDELCVRSAWYWYI